MPAPRCAVSLALAALLLAGCGSAEPTSTAPATATAGAAPATGRQLQGPGYAMNLAQGWHDAKPEGLGAGQDTAIADALGNVMTVGRGKVPAAAAASGTQRVLTTAFRDEMKSVKPTNVTDPKPILVDAKAGITFEFRYRSPGGVIRVREVFALDKGYFYDFSLITRPEQFTAAHKAFDSMLSSARWT